jgi:hypothetical protein
MQTRRRFLVLLAMLLWPVAASARRLQPSKQFRLVNGWICKAEDLTEG